MEIQLKYKIEILHFISIQTTTRNEICKKLIIHGKPYDYKDIDAYLKECKTNGIIFFDHNAGNQLYLGDIQGDDKLGLSSKGYGELEILNEKLDSIKRQEAINSRQLEIQDKQIMLTEKSLMISSQVAKLTRWIALGTIVAAVYYLFELNKNHLHWW